MASKDTETYLKDIKERMIDYDKIRLIVSDYIFDNEINNVELVTHLFVLGFLWNAHQRGEDLSQNELNMLLGADDTIPMDYDSSLELLCLDDEQAEYEILDLLDLAVDSFET